MLHSQIYGGSFVPILVLKNKGVKGGEF